MSIRIAGRPIGQEHDPYLIAEMSGNHNQSLDRALEIISRAAQCGADAVKLQTYTADTMTIKCDREEFRINDPGSLWSGKSLYELYEEASTPWAWHEPMFKHARALGVTVFSTPFDETAVDFLEGLGAPAYKIASFENTDLPLIRKVAGTGKPLIISLGMATLAETEECVKTARNAGCSELVLLKCTSSYPASAETSNLRTIPHLRAMFDCEVGLSDHTLGIGAAVASVALGASVIEKHFTLARADGGVDSAFSMEPEEFQALVREARLARQAMGGIQYGPTQAETASLAFRRSLYVVSDIEKGQVLTRENIRAIRPGFGLPPKYVDKVLGMRATRKLTRGTPLAWNLLTEQWP